MIAAVAIEIRERDIVEGVATTKPDEVIWIEPPPPDHYVSIRMSLLLPDTGAHSYLGGRPVEAIGLADNSALIIASKVEPIDPARFDPIDAQRTAALKAARFSNRVAGVRLSLFGHDENGIRYVHDTAVLPEEMILAEPPVLPKGAT